MRRRHEGGRNREREREREAQSLGRYIDISTYRSTPCRFCLGFGGFRPTRENQPVVADGLARKALYLIPMEYGGYGGALLLLCSAQQPRPGKL